MSTTASRWPWIAPILIYIVSALEMIIMVSPFAAYFYSVYTPLFHGLQQSELTAWLPQFFLPHLAHTRWFVFRALGWLGAALTLIGIIGFFACAIQLYYGKFVRKQLVSGGLYGRVRHPQYLCLAVAGLGLLLLWPRFFILVTYLMMLGLYYVLARHEEELIRVRYGKATDEYLARVPMINPFGGRREWGAWHPPSRTKAFATWAAIVVVSLGAAFGLRNVAIGQLYAVQAPGVTTLAFRAKDDERLREITDAVLATQPLQAWLNGGATAPLFLQIAPSEGQMKHLLVDLGMKEAPRNALDLPESDELIIVSHVVGSEPGTSPDPFAIGTRIEPLFLAYDNAGTMFVQALVPDDFYPDFARIRF
jgi:protein-S-isoprenylcysteine O-methyltransferase Ste14